MSKPRALLPSSLDIRFCLQLFILVWLSRQTFITIGLLFPSVNISGAPPRSKAEVQKESTFHFSEEVACIVLMYLFILIFNLFQSCVCVRVFTLRWYTAWRCSHSLIKANKHIYHYYCMMSQDLNLNVYCRFVAAWIADNTALSLLCFSLYVSSVFHDIFMKQRQMTVWGSRGSLGRTVCFYWHLLRHFRNNIKMLHGDSEFKT